MEKTTPDDFTEIYMSEINSLTPEGRYIVNVHENFYYDEWRKFVVNFLRSSFPGTEAWEIDHYFLESNCWSDFLSIVRSCSLEDFYNKERPSQLKASRSFEVFVNEMVELNRNVTSLDEINFSSDWNEAFIERLNNFKKSISNILEAN